MSMKPIIEDEWYIWYGRICSARIQRMTSEEAVIEHNLLRKFTLMLFDVLTDINPELANNLLHETKAVSNDN